MSEIPEINLELISPFSQGLLLFLDTMDIVSKYISGIGLQYMLLLLFLNLTLHLF